MPNTETKLIDGEQWRKLREDEEPTLRDMWHCGTQSGEVLGRVGSDLTLHGWQIAIKSSLAKGLRADGLLQYWRKVEAPGVVAFRSDIARAMGIVPCGYISRSCQNSLRPLIGQTVTVMVLTDGQVEEWRYALDHAPVMDDFDYHSKECAKRTQCAIHEMIDALKQSKEDPS
jgi:hypothetical protein